MKQLNFLFFAFLFINISNAQNVGIGTSSPNAALEVKSTNNGFLPPRLTIAQRNTITNPAVGLIIFCTECDELQFYNGTIWKSMSGTAACISPSLPSVAICNQIWMTKNLDVSNYRNGDPIPQVSNPSVWTSLTTGAWCWYNNDSATYAATYGKLYNWYAVNDPRGLAPQGWHIPSKAEWTKLTDTCLGNAGVAGGKMKEIGTSHWQSPNVGATNSSGFTGLPGAARDASGPFYGIGSFANLWASTEGGPATAWNIFFYSNSTNVEGANGFKADGYSVRCVRD